MRWATPPQPTLEADGAGWSGVAPHRISPGRAGGPGGGRGRHEAPDCSPEGRLRAAGAYRFGSAWGVPVWPSAGLEATGRARQMGGLPRGGSLRGGPGHRALKLVLRGTIFGLRREAKPFGEVPKGVLKLASPDAKSRLPQRSGCSFQADGAFGWSRGSEVEGRAAVDPDLCAFGHRFFALQ